MNTFGATNYHSQPTSLSTGNGKKSRVDPAAEESLGRYRSQSRVFANSHEAHEARKNTPRNLNLYAMYDEGLDDDLKAPDPEISAYATPTSFASPPAATSGNLSDPGLEAMAWPEGGLNIPDDMPGWGASSYAYNGADSFTGSPPPAPHVPAGIGTPYNGAGLNLQLPSDDMPGWGTGGYSSNAVDCVTTSPAPQAAPPSNCGASLASEMPASGADWGTISYESPSYTPNEPEAPLEITMYDEDMEDNADDMDLDQGFVAENTTHHGALVMVTVGDGFRSNSNIGSHHYHNSFTQSPYLLTNTGGCGTDGVASNDYEMEDLTEVVPAQAWQEQRLQLSLLGYAKERGNNNNELALAQPRINEQAQRQIALLREESLEEGEIPASAIESLYPAAGGGAAAPAGAESFALSNCNQQPLRLEYFTNASAAGQQMGYSSFSAPPCASLTAILAPSGSILAIEQGPGSIVMYGPSMHHQQQQQQQGGFMYSAASMRASYENISCGYTPLPGSDLETPSRSETKVISSPESYYPIARSLAEMAAAKAKYDADEAKRKEDYSCDGLFGQSMFDTSGKSMAHIREDNVESEVDENTSSSLYSNSEDKEDNDAENEDQVEDGEYKDEAGYESEDAYAEVPHAQPQVEEQVCYNFNFNFPPLPDDDPELDEEEEDCSHESERAVVLQLQVEEQVCYIFPPLPDDAPELDEEEDSPESPEYTLTPAQCERGVYATREGVCTPVSEISGNNSNFCSPCSFAAGEETSLEEGELPRDTFITPTRVSYADSGSIVKWNEPAVEGEKENLQPNARTPIATAAAAAAAAAGEEALKQMLLLAEMAKFDDDLEEVSEVETLDSQRAVVLGNLEALSRRAVGIAKALKRPLDSYSIENKISGEASSETIKAVGSPWVRGSKQQKVKHVPAGVRSSLRVAAVLSTRPRKVSAAMRRSLQAARKELQAQCRSEEALAAGSGTGEEVGSEQEIEPSAEAVPVPEGQILNEEENEVIAADDTSTPSEANTEATVAPDATTVEEAPVDVTVAQRVASESDSAAALEIPSADLDTATEFETEAVVDESAAADAEVEGDETAEDRSSDSAAANEIDIAAMVESLQAIEINSQPVQERRAAPSAALPVLVDDEENAEVEPVAEAPLVQEEVVVQEERPQMAPELEPPAAVGAQQVVEEQPRVAPIRVKVTYSFKGVLRDVGSSAGGAGRGALAPTASAAMAAAAAAAPVVAAQRGGAGSLEDSGIVNKSAKNGRVGFGGMFSRLGAAVKSWA